MDTNVVIVILIVVVIINATHETVVRVGLGIVSLFLLSSFLFKHKDKLQTYFLNPGTEKPVTKPEEKKVIDESSILSQVEPFKKYNEYAYEQGLKYHSILKEKLTQLNGGNKKHPGNELSDLDYYLNLCINQFQDISLSLPSKTFKQAYNSGDYTMDTSLEKLHLIVNQLYEFNRKTIDGLYKQYSKSKDINQSYQLPFSGPQASNDKNSYELY